jgi:hypothetical protein
MALVTSWEARQMTVLEEPVVRAEAVQSMAA